MEGMRGVERLVSAVSELSLARSLERIVEIVRHAGRELTGCDGATFVLRDGDKCYYVDEDAISPLWAGERFPMDTCISGWVMEHRRPAVIPDIYLDDRIPHDAYKPTFVTSMAMVPIRELEPIGAIGNYWAEPHEATESEVQRLQALANATSIAMENVAVHAELAEAHHRSVTDELTGVLGRRGFAQTAQAHLDAAHIAGVNALVAYVDLDGLKGTNDTHGHSAGDAMIRRAAEALGAATRHSDIVARMGGDEFCVLATDLPEGGAALKARLVAELAARRIEASIGYVEVTPETSVSANELLAIADSRMYAEKQERRSAR